MLDDAIKKYGLMLLITAMLFSLVFTEGGILGLVKTKMEIGRVNTEIKRLSQENVLLMHELDRLQKDDSYLEEVVRKKYGFLREGEKLYRIEK
ncbi:MAG TPA: septum formation initiator family protein [Syntrophorhabdaceae bacterium]|jgi:cell division protein FtsB|nr:septum formation initiator family protein [Syntrophorhabdaceae bacterium]HOB69121.1 septum formation initiator family protein [Syntrophorhabdaceae bacterium]HOF56928.1 septum formation initiator family protein [Syntrophorhabdaceae bacterium]HOS04559.1 septum formation initiator family protein [Syntrophorhabdaceae bacterium]HPH41108.1 septum formation initiator family protein [Syntrophorhabdaceae bacterium]